MEKSQLKALCTCEYFKIDELKASFEYQYMLFSVRDVTYFSIGNGTIFIFTYGVIVCWGGDSIILQNVLEKIRQFEVNSLKDIEIDKLTYVLQEDIDATKINLDTIYLHADDTMVKFAISHGVAQSLKLSSFEMSIQKAIDETEHIPRNLSISGRVNMTRKSIAKFRGMLFLEKANIHLLSGLLDTPEFFWDFPELEKFYQMTNNYLDVAPRTIVLNKKLDIIQELLHMLADEQNHKYSSTLEWIIIVLIAIEILFTILHDFLRLI